jgi:hypothetical protein
MRKVGFSLFSLFITLPIYAAAQQSFPLTNPLGVGTIPALIDKIATYLIELAAPIVTIMILIGAFKMLTAAGNETKFAEGKKTVTYAAIGMAIVILAKGITAIITSFLQS